MCKYEMDSMSIVEDTERTRFCPQTDKVKPVYPPFNFAEVGGVLKKKNAWSDAVHHKTIHNLNWFNQ